MGKATVAIIGQGYVGTAFKKFVENHYDVVTYDPKFDKTYPQKAIDKADFAVICVPTPPAADGSCDTSMVEAAVSKLHNQHILIKSTIAPGTTDRLSQKYHKQICFSPEYIGESTYFNPFYKTMSETPFLVIGGPASEAKYFFEKLEVILGPLATYYHCRALEAELIKYMENAFIAVKVTFANEFYEIAQRFDVDWHKVREGWLLDQRVGRAGTSVFASKRGYSGKCLPKDVSAIIETAKAAGYLPKLLLQTKASNEEFLDKTPDNR